MNSPTSLQVKAAFAFVRMESNIAALAVKLHAPADVIIAALSKANAAMHDANTVYLQYCQGHLDRMDIARREEAKGVEPAVAIEEHSKYYCAQLHNIALNGLLSAFSAANPTKVNPKTGAAI
jgi:hypothetical protein